VTGLSPIFRLMARKAFRVAALLLGNVPGMPRALKVEYLRAALGSIDPMHHDVPGIVRQINDMERAS
jgi:hypothetical protein